MCSHPTASCGDPSAACRSPPPVRSSSRTQFSRCRGGLRQASVRFSVTTSDPLRGPGQKQVPVHVASSREGGLEVGTRPGRFEHWTLDPDEPSIRMWLVLLCYLWSCSRSCGALDHLNEELLKDGSAKSGDALPSHRGENPAPAGLKMRCLPVSSRAALPEPAGRSSAGGSERSARA
jgi:hypothetical protein